MSKPKSEEICRLHLFDDVDKLQRAGLSIQIQEKIKRIRAIYTLFIRYPLKKEKEVCDMMMSQFPVDRSTVYEDIKIAKVFVGDFSSASKPWCRFRFNKMIDDAYTMAERKQNAVAMVMAADKYGKYNQLDKEDAERIPWEEMIVQRFEITSDPTVIGIKPQPNIKEKIKKMKDKYFGEIQTVDFIEMPSDIDALFTQTPTNLPPDE